MKMLHHGFRHLNRVFAKSIQKWVELLLSTNAWIARLIRGLLKSDQTDVDFLVQSDNFSFDPGGKVLILRVDFREPT